MSRWSGLAIAGIWIGMAIISFNVGITPIMKDIAGYGAGVSLVIAVLEMV
jgi:hypothetical protein